MIKTYITHFSFHNRKYNLTPDLITFVHVLSDDPDKSNTIKSTVLQAPEMQEFLGSGAELDNLTFDEVPVDVCPANSPDSIVITSSGVFIKLDLINSDSDFKMLLFDLLSIYNEQIDHV